MRKKNTQLQFAVICIFLFCFLNKKESHLNASESGIEASSLQQKAFMAVCYFIHTQCPLLHTLLRVSWVQHRWTRESGISAWLCLATGPRVSRQWATFYSVNLPDCCRHIRYREAVPPRLFRKRDARVCETRSRARNVLLTTKSPT